MTNNPVRLDLAHNKFADDERNVILLFVAVSIVITLAAYIFGYVKSNKDHKVNLGTYCNKVNRFTAILAVPPLLSLLQFMNLDESHPMLSVFLCMCIGLIGVNFIYRLYDHVKNFRMPKSKIFGRKNTPLYIVVIISLIYAATLSHYNFTQHHNLGTRAWDFGLYINSFWHSLHGNFLGCSYLPTGNHINRHFDPILVLISPILLIYAKAEALIVFQSLWIGLGAIPLYLIVNRSLKNPWFGIAASLIYFFHPGINGPNMFEFHSLT